MRAQGRQPRRRSLLVALSLDVGAQVGLAVEKLAAHVRPRGDDIGLFVMVGALEERGFIDEITQGIADLTAGDRTAEIMGIMWASVIGSAIVDNIPFTATMIPVVDSLQGGADEDAYWWALALGACFGGNATIIAAAANVAAAGMAARAGAPITFMAFLRAGIPATLISMLVATVYVWIRYHPAIVAQAAATLAEMFPGRLSVALGTGEFSNEHITGQPWPGKAVRNARLRECVDVVRALFAGEVVDHDGS